MGVRRLTLRVQPPIPFGDVTMVPEPLSGRSEIEMARAIAAALADVEVLGAADLCDRLQQSIPSGSRGSPMAALGGIMERLRRSF